MYFSMTLVCCLNILNIRYLQRTKDCVEKTLNRLEGKICGRVSFVTLYFFFGLVFFFFNLNFLLGNCLCSCYWIHSCSSKFLSSFLLTGIEQFVISDAGC